jgi:hypothetical protein
MMALQTTTFDYIHSVGDLREDYGRWTSDDTSGHVQTRLSWIYQVEVMSPGAGLQHLEVHPNSNSTTQDAEDQAAAAGAFYYGGSADTEALRYRAIGK